MPKTMKTSSLPFLLDGGYLQIAHSYLYTAELVFKEGEWVRFGENTASAVEMLCRHLHIREGISFTESDFIAYRHSIFRFLEDIRWTGVLTETEITILKVSVSILSKINDDDTKTNVIISGNKEMKDTGFNEFKYGNMNDERVCVWTHMIFTKEKATSVHRKVTPVLARLIDEYSQDILYSDTQTKIRGRT